MIKNLSKGELEMWNSPVVEFSEKISDAEINAKYTAGEHRIVTEINREKIPNFVKALEKEDYMQVRPFYQRRERWDIERQSKLIESFIINVPVPPIFVYEKDFNKHEVMDGQQRITALKSFYAGEFKLKGLEIWKELNGRTYSTLPSQVRSGLDRRSISYIVVLRESTPNEEDAMFLRQTVFERLNTGGVKLEHQEIRNCLFQGALNKLLVDLTKTDDFRDTFSLPRYQKEEEFDDSPIQSIPLYQKMEDAEYVLRFFALRSAEKYTRGMQGFLSLYMERGLRLENSDIEFLRHLFSDTLSLAREIYGDLVFRPYSIDSDAWETKPQKAFYDAVMVSLSECLAHREKLVASRTKIIESTKQLFLENEQGTFTGRGNSKSDIQERIRKFGDMILQYT